MNIEKQLLKENDQKILQISFNNIEVVDFQVNMINTNESRGLVQLEKYARDLRLVLLIFLMTQFLRLLTNA